MDRIFSYQNKLSKNGFVIIGIFLEILKEWFSKNDTQFKYNSDPSKSKLVIEPSYEFKPELCQQRPGLFIKRGPIAPKGIGRSGTDDLLRYKEDASKEYLILSRSNILVMCISSLPGEAELLSWESCQLLIAMAPILKRDYNFIIFNVEQIGELNKMDEYKEFWLVPISVSLGYAEPWRIKELTPLLNQVLVNTFTKDQ